MKKIILLHILLALTTHANDFAFKLYKHLSKTEGNLIFSPASIETALAMTAEGARENTQKQLIQTLETNYTNKPSTFQGLELSTANAIWINQNLPILGTFKTAIREKYNANIQSADFRNQPDAERQKINQWIKTKTRDKIKNLLPKGSIGTNTRMLLVNAIYFKGNWLNAFDKTKTIDAPFHGADEVPMMTMKAEQFDYLGNDRFQCLELPYKGEEASMLIILPREESDITHVENELATICAKPLNKTEMKIFLPRFKTETTLTSLKKTLITLGISDAFDPTKADFSAISTHPLFISEVAHKAFIEINEEGTEAAAATGIMMGITCMPMPPKIFRADRPFIFLIRENATGKILFMGRITNPQK